MTTVLSLKLNVVLQMSAKGNTETTRDHLKPLVAGDHFCMTLNRSAAQECTCVRCYFMHRVLEKPESIKAIPGLPSEPLKTRG